MLLTVDFVEEANELLFEVSDTGIGIPDKFQSTLFDPFTQADQSLTRKPHVGFGLGLAIAKQLTNRLNGSLLVTSAEKKGSTFSLRIPYMPPEQHPLPDPSDANSPVFMIQTASQQTSAPPMPDRSSIVMKVCGRVSATRKSTTSLFAKFGIDASEWDPSNPEDTTDMLLQADYIWIDPE